MLTRAGPPGPGTLELVDGPVSIIPATTGEETFDKSDLVNDPRSLNDSFTESQYDELQPDTIPRPATEVEVYKLIQGANLTQIFAALPIRLDSLAFTESQVIAWVREYNAQNDFLNPWLHYRAVFFVVRRGQAIFVAILGGTGKIYVSILTTNDPTPFFASDSDDDRADYHIIIPKWK